jgi:hypothetical protein
VTTTKQKERKLGIRLEEGASLHQTDVHQIEGQTAQLEVIVFS